MEIRIKFASWIRIRLLNANPDPAAVRNKLVLKAEFTKIFIFSEKMFKLQMVRIKLAFIMLVIVG